MQDWTGGNRRLREAEHCCPLTVLAVFWKVVLIEMGVDRMCSEVYERWSMCCAARLIVSATDFLQPSSSAPACAVQYFQPSVNK
jgi:hypothetical protein